MLGITEIFENHLNRGKNCSDCLRNKCTDMTHEVYKKLDASILFITGDEDDVVWNPRTREIFVQMVMGKRTGQELKYIEIAGMNHGPFSDAQMIDRVMNLIRKWLII